METDRGIEATLERIRQLGVRLALDDFGTGYSSLAYLKRFDVGTVKVDQTFVTNVPMDEGSSAIVSAIIAMSHALGKKVVAEGVETAAQYAFLVNAGCDCVQGYFVSAPLKPDDLAAFCARSHDVEPPRPDRSFARMLK